MVVSPTPTDYANAIIYALERVKKETCTGDHFKYRKRQHRYRCPEGLKCMAGDCVFATKQTCDTHSATVNGLPKKKKKSCTSTDGCTFPDRCSKDGVCTGQYPYLEWKNGKCHYGDANLKLFCEHPKLRRQEAVHGVTDVPPFRYTPGEGCSLTEPYCTWMGVDYDAAKKDCTRKAGQVVGEFFLGKTLFRDLHVKRVFGVPVRLEPPNTITVQRRDLGDQADKFDFISKYVNLNIV